MEVTNASTMVENVNFFFDACQSISFNFLIYLVFYPSPDLLLCQILPDETPVQDREPNSLLNDPVGVEGDLVTVNTQTVDSLVRQTTDGEGFICSICLCTAGMN